MVSRRLPNRTPARLRRLGASLWKPPWQDSNASWKECLGIPTRMPHALSSIYTARASAVLTSSPRRPSRPRLASSVAEPHQWISPCRITYERCYTPTALGALLGPLLAREDLTERSPTCRYPFAPAQEKRERGFVAPLKRPVATRQQRAHFAHESQAFGASLTEIYPGRLFTLSNFLYANYHRHQSNAVLPWIGLAVIYRFRPSFLSICCNLLFPFVRRLLTVFIWMALEGEARGRLVDNRAFDTAHLGQRARFCKLT